MRRTLTSQSGQITYAKSYNPYGTVTSTSGPSQTAYGYTGEGQDPSGLTYLRARYYNPSTGRFISKDSFAGYVTSPQSQNPFTYTQNNPILYVDPTGHYSWNAFIAEAKDLIHDPVGHTYREIQKNSSMPWQCTDVGQIALWAAPAIMPLVILAALPIIMVSPDSIIDVGFLALDAYTGDSHAFALDAMVLLIPGVTGLGELSRAEEAYDTFHLINDADNLSDANHVLTKQDIINDLIDSGTSRSTAIAEAMQEEKIITNIYTDEEFAALLKRIEPDITPEQILKNIALNNRNEIYLRASRGITITSDAVHEGSHALDYFDYLKGEYKGKSVAELHSWEKRSYYYERQFILYKGRELPSYMKILPDMLQHIIENY